MPPWPAAPASTDDAATLRKEALLPVSNKNPIEVAIVGGGCASMAAAFELTRPELGGR
jgi:ribulose 1,5-bisphosphate synthetase/thiazole synthase